MAQAERFRNCAGLVTAPYKAPDPNKIETILIRKAWKVGSCRQVTTRLFSECVITGYHPKALSVGQTTALRKPNKSETPTRSYLLINLFNCL